MRILVDQTGGPEEKQMCANCKYFDIDAIYPDDDRESWCCRYPPVYIAPDEFTSDGYDDDVMDANYWNHPRVMVGNWCGEWAAREDDDEAW